MKKRYLGDSVYVELREPDGALMLTTDNGYGPSNIIVIDDEVWEDLMIYHKQIHEESKEKYNVSNTR